jgi:hypothetical protein
MSTILPFADARARSTGCQWYLADPVAGEVRTFADADP